MKVLILGGGGREHALALALRRSPRLCRLWVAPGNAGTAMIAENVQLHGNEAVVAFAKEMEVDLVIVGPEAPLVDGVADALTAARVPVFGPSAAAAQLEASKGFTKELCLRAGVPTSPFRRFEDAGAALRWLAEQQVPIVVKADGLMAGKGVVVATTRAEAEQAVRTMSASGPIVIEGFLSGEEASLFALVDGETVVPFGTARDYKRVGNGDTGPNTGGMGTISPAPALTPDLEARALDEIVRPTARAMAAAGTVFRGFLYAGLMLTADGPQLIEYNVRLGDPEAQSLLPRLKDDLLELLTAAASGRLPATPPSFDPSPAVTVVVAARGYPAAPETGGRVGGLDGVEAAGATVIHAGTALDEDGQIVAAGGRVLGVRAVGESIEAARQTVYRALSHLDYPGGFWRTDIAEGFGFPMMRVLFVCLGNICRSPLAEGVFRQAAEQAGLTVEIDSAGTGDWHIGSAPDPRAQGVARANGVDIAHLRARQVVPDDFRRFSHVIGMDSSNIADLERLRPADGTATVAPFMAFAPQLGLKDVPDPYYGTEKDFEEVWRLIKAAAEGLVKTVKI